jgi:excisionase family DNA binding protein
MARTHPDSSTDGQLTRLTVPEAARVLGVGVDAIYKRVSRGTLEHEKDEDGRLYIYLDTADIEANQSTDASTDTYRKAYINALKSENELLRAELESRKVEAERKDTLLLNLMQRIPQLEPAAGVTEDTPREAPKTPPEAPEDEDNTSVSAEHTDEPRASWWKRFFGLE